MLSSGRLAILAFDYGTGSIRAVAQGLVDASHMRIA
jgi:hypothetical protein